MKKDNRVMTVRPLTGAALLLLVLMGACSARKEAPKAKPPVPVTVASAVLKTVPIEIRAVGTVEAYNSVAIKAQVNGQISQVHFREGQEVRKGDLLFTIDPRPFKAALQQAEAALARDQAQASFAREQANRYGSLLKDGIVTQDQYDQLRANADAYQATIAADKSIIEGLSIQLSYCSIRSPLAGRSGTIMVQSGNLVKANDNPVLVTINQISPVYVSFVLPERELSTIKPKLAKGAMAVVAVIPTEGNSSEQGVVSFLDNAVDVTTGTIRLKGTFANSQRRLWPGQFVNVVMTVDIRKDALVVPTAAVQTGQQGQYLFIVGADQAAELRPVTVGISYEGMTVIEKGVKSGEVVVTDGQMRIAPGAKVMVKPAPEPGKAAIPAAAAVSTGSVKQ